MKQTQTKLIWKILLDSMAAFNTLSPISNTSLHVSSMHSSKHRAMFHRVMKVRSDSSLDRLFILQLYQKSIGSTVTLDIGTVSALGLKKLNRVASQWFHPSRTPKHFCSTSL